MSGYRDNRFLVSYSKQLLFSEDLFWILGYVDNGTGYLESTSLSPDRYPEELIPRVSSGVPGEELTLRVHLVYSIHVVLLRRHPGSTRRLRPYMGGRGDQEAQGATPAFRRNHSCTRREPFFC